MFIFFYRFPFNKRFSIHKQWQLDNLSNVLPKDIEVVVSEDKNLLDIADVVVIDLPFLISYYYKDNADLDKKENQIWVAWNLECEANYPWMLSEDIANFIDVWMTYKLDSDVVFPYCDYTFKEKLFTPPQPKTKDICMFVSSGINNSKRLHYLTELMKHIKIDSYGWWKQNCRILNDVGYESKLEVIKNYKFTIAFENATGEDYVTEKFFEPLLVGSVPVYLGAPNIDRYAPGENSYINVKDFDSPKELASVLTEYCANEEKYNRLLEWKTKPLNAELHSLIELQRVHPFERLVNYIRENY